MAAVMELADAIAELTDAEKDNLRELLPHIVVDGPRSEVAGFKIAAITTRIKGAGFAVMKDLLTSIATDAAKKAMGFS
jgi:hypothetical protein